MRPSVNRRSVAPVKAMCAWRPPGPRRTAEKKPDRRRHRRLCRNDGESGRLPNRGLNRTEGRNGNGFRSHYRRRGRRSCSRRRRQLAYTGIGARMQDGASTALARLAVADIDPLRLATDGGLQCAAMTTSDAFHNRLHRVSPESRRRGGGQLLIRRQVSARHFQRPLAFPNPDAAGAPPNALSPLPPNRQSGMRRPPPCFPRDRCLRGSHHQV